MTEPKLLSKEELKKLLAEHDDSDMRLSEHISALEAKLARYATGVDRLGGHSVAAIRDVAGHADALLRDASAHISELETSLEHARKERDWHQTSSRRHADERDEYAVRVTTLERNGSEMTAALEKAIEQVRKERDEARGLYQQEVVMRQQAECERDDGIAAVRANIDGTRERAEAAERQRDEALADYAALVEMLREWLEAEGDAESPDLKDMTPKQRAAFVCYMKAHDVAGRPHPGAALLEGHHKALVIARNEGLEKAAQVVESADDGVPLQMLADDGIRAMKEET